MKSSPWVFSKVMRELAIYWRKCGISVLPYLDDFFLTKKGKYKCLQLCFRPQKDFVSAGLITIVPKCCLPPLLVMLQPCFDIDMAEGKFRVPVDCWEAYQSLNDSILSTKGGRVQPRKLASMAGIVISMKLSWGPVTQLYSRHIYVLV